MTDDPWPTYALSAVVYVERDGKILLLERAEGSELAGQWFLPGGAVERDELPEEAARRELLEEAGIGIDGDLELVGAYPIRAYGRDCLQLSYRGTAGPGEPSISAEHTGARWVDPADMRALLTDEVIASIARGNPVIDQLVRRVRDDLDAYLRRVAGP